MKRFLHVSFKFTVKSVTIKSIFFALHVTETVHPHTKEMLQQQYIKIKEVLHTDRKNFIIMCAISPC